MEPPMTVADLVDPSSAQDGISKRESETEREKSMRDRRVAEILRLLEMSKKSLERIQDMVETL
jgi:hypothetical protein